MFFTLLILKICLHSRWPSFGLPFRRFLAVSLPSLQSIYLPSFPSPSLGSVFFPACSLLLRILPSRFFGFTSEHQTEPSPVPGTVLRECHSVLRFQFSTATGTPDPDPPNPAQPAHYHHHPHPEPHTRPFSLLLNLQLEVKEQPDRESYPAPPSLPAPLLEGVILSAGEEEEEDEGLCSPHISYLGVREEDARDDDSDVEQGCD